MILRFATCRLDTDQRLLSREGKPVPTEPQVFDLLVLLAENPGRVVTRDEIVEAVWQGRIVSESAISARIAAARKAVGDDGKRQAVIRTVARRGLQMAVPVTLDASPGQASGTLPAGTQRIRYTDDGKGRAIAYAVTGAGPPLFRLGYNTTHLEAEWKTPAERRFFDDLGAHHRLLRYDPVGFGMSDRAPFEQIDFAEIARNALAAADAAGFERFAAMSESGGVLTAVHLAAMAPERVTRLVIAGGYVDGRGRREASRQSDVFRALIADSWKSNDLAFMSAFLLAYFPEGPLDAVHDMARNFLAAASEENLTRMREAIDGASIRHMLTKVRCPTLILHARADAVHPLSEARKLAAGIPDAELVVLETANHMPIPGNPAYEAYITAILDFLAG